MIQGWWGFTFPIGVFAVSTRTIAQELPSRFFRVLATVHFLLPIWLTRMPATDVANAFLSSTDPILGRCMPLAFGRNPDRHRLSLGEDVLCALRGRI
jgi:hypothetical protein